MYRTFLSWRYLVSRRTNLIGVVGIFVAVGALILIRSIMSGFLNESRRHIRGSLSDVIITPEHLARPDQRVAAIDPDGMLAVLRSDPRVESATAHLVWYGLIVEDAEIAIERLGNARFGSQNLVQVVGIDVDDEFRATELRGSLEREPVYGQPVEDPAHPFALPPESVDDWGLPKPCILVGEQLMRFLRLERGDVITLATGVPDPDGGDMNMQNGKFIVAGSFRSGENEMDLERVYIERSELRDFLGEVRDYSEVLVKLVDYERDSDELLLDLRNGLSALALMRGRQHEVLTWEDFRGSLLGAIENERALMGVMLSLVLLVASFLVFAIVSMMVTDKTRDIGILTALGATPRGVMVLFLQVGFWDALVGSLLGTISGWWAAVEINSIELWLRGPFSGFLTATLGWLFGEIRVEIFNRDVYLFDHIPSQVEPVAVAVIVIGAFTASLLFSAWPAWRAARVDPITALRFE